MSKKAVFKIVSGLHIFLLSLLTVFTFFTAYYLHSQINRSEKVRASAINSWYLDNRATGNNNGTSWENAWNSFSGINWNLVNPGDTIYISGGQNGQTYTGEINFSKNGSAGLPITIDSGANSPYSQGHNGAVTIEGGSYCIRANGNYVIIRNLTCQNATSSGFRIQGVGSVVENTIVRNTYQQGIHLYNCTNCLVRGNRVTTHNDIAQQTDGITIYQSSNVVVEKNWIKVTNQNNCTSCHNDGIQSNKTTDLTVRYNYVENTKNNTANAQAIYATQMNGTVKYYGNVVILPYGGQALTNTNLDIGTSHTVVVNNVIKCGGYRCLYIGEDTSPIIKNNITWQTGISDVVRLSDQYNRGVTLSAIPDSDIDNNIWYAPSGDSKVFDTISGQMNWSSWQSQGFDAHGKYINPGLDNCLRPATKDGPSNGVGTTLDMEYTYGLSTSLCGQNGPDSFLPVSLSIRKGSGWDIGAYEYTGLQPTSGLTPTSFLTPTITAKPSLSPTNTTTPTPTVKPTFTPTPSPKPSYTPTPKPTNTPTPRMSLSTTPSPSPTPNFSGDFKGEYFNNKYLSGTPKLVRNDQTIYFNWGWGSPDHSIAKSYFSVRWTKSEIFERGRYKFTVRHDDGLRIYIDGKRIYDKWYRQSATTKTFEHYISEGRHNIKIEYYENNRTAEVKVSYFKL